MPRVKDCIIIWENVRPGEDYCMVVADEDISAYNSEVGVLGFSNSGRILTGVSRIERISLGRTYTGVPNLTPTGIEEYLNNLYPYLGARLEKVMLDIANEIGENMNHSNNRARFKEGIINFINQNTHLTHFADRDMIMFVGPRGDSISIIFIRQSDIFELVKYGIDPTGYDFGFDGTDWVIHADS